MIGLEYILKIEKMSTAALAQRLKVTPPTITQWVKQNRTIPTERIGQLHGVFPAYPMQYFQKVINEQDAIELQNYMIDYYLDTLKDKDDIESIRTKNILARKREYNDNLIMQQRVITQLKTVFAKSFELSRGDKNYYLMYSKMIDNFVRFCNVQKKIVTLSATMSRADSELKANIKDFTEYLREQVETLDYLSILSE